MSRRFKHQRLASSRKRNFMKRESESRTSMISKKHSDLKITNLKIERQSGTRESVQITKKKISPGKLMTLKKLTQKQKLSKIADLDFTRTGLDLNPFWNKYTLELSKQLWSPTKTDCVDLELNSLNGFSKNLMLNSWFPVQIQENKMCQENFPKISSPLLQSLSQKTTDLGLQSINERERSKIATHKIMLYP